MQMEMGKCYSPSDYTCLRLANKNCSENLLLAYKGYTRNANSVDQKSTLSVYIITVPWKGQVRRTLPSKYGQRRIIPHWEVKHQWCTSVDFDLLGMVDYNFISLRSWARGLKSFSFLNFFKVRKWESMLIHLRAQCCQNYWLYQQMLQIKII